VGNVRTKIFGIGLSKTGTSSLAQALERLGFKTRDCMGATRYIPGDLSSIDMDTVLAHDALTDTPIPSFYRELDQRFPGSRFILTVRDQEGWLKSCKKQFNERSAAAQNEAHRQIFEDLYGTNIFDERRFASGYERFVNGVFEYFKHRPQDLLVLDVARGDGWEKLCPFVERPVPDVPFPKANVTKIRWMSIEDLVAVAEAAGRELLKRYRGKIALPTSSKAARRPLEPMALLDRALQAALGRDAPGAAAQAAHKVIVAGLKKLNSDIPILSPLEEPATYSERKHWNHVWLVDPLDGRQALTAAEDDFSVNLALIEDGRPIYGVVHAPAKGVTYFARAGKGAFRRGVGGTAIRLAPQLSEAAEASPANSVADGDGASRGLAMCRLLERFAADGLIFSATSEWRMAAAHAVLRAADIDAVDGASGQQPAYNSERLSVGPLRVRAKEPA
jgi:3'-phosphoadenosine 5'-phosphosulfate (PAPS) 3'-phosphatase